MPIVIVFFPPTAVSLELVTNDQCHDNRTGARFRRELADDQVPVINPRADHGLATHLQREAARVRAQDAIRVEADTPLPELSRKTR